MGKKNKTYKTAIRKEKTRRKGRERGRNCMKRREE